MTDKRVTPKNKGKYAKKDAPRSASKGKGVSSARFHGEASERDEGAFSVSAENRGTAKKKLRWRGGTLLSPLPVVIVTSGTAKQPCSMTAAWTGIVCSDPAMTYVSIRPERFSHGVIEKNEEFVINLTTAAMARAVDYIGVRSSRDENKLEKTRLSVQPGFETECPVIVESPLSLECRVTEIKKLGSHDMFLAEIVAVDVDESLLDDAGKLSLARSGLLAYSHGDYMTLGKKLGSFGFSVKKKKTSAQKKTKKSRDGR